jgi:hypothetical protein
MSLNDLKIKRVKNACLMIKCNKNNSYRKRRRMNLILIVTGIKKKVWNG